MNAEDIVRIIKNKLLCLYRMNNNGRKLKQTDIKINVLESLLKEIEEAGHEHQ